MWSTGSERSSGLSQCKKPCQDLPRMGAGRARDKLVKAISEGRVTRRSGREGRDSDHREQVGLDVGRLQMRVIASYTDSGGRRTARTSRCPKVSSPESLRSSRIGHGQQRIIQSIAHDPRFSMTGCDIAQ